MSTVKPSPRSLLIGFASAWFAAHYVEILSAQNHVAAGDDRGFAFFTAEQAAEVEAIAGQIIPTDHSAGAREAHVVSFIDRALATFESGRQSDYTQGLQE